MEKKYKEIRILVKPVIWEKIKKKVKNSRYNSINELVRHHLFEFAKEGGENEQEYYFFGEGY